MEKQTILVVEDNPVFQSIEEGALRNAGYRTRWTDATEEARRILETKKIALVILDCDEIRAEPYGDLLRYEGYRFIKELRQNPRFPKDTLPIIGITTWLPRDAGSWRNAFLKAGGNAFMEQPIDPDKLVAQVLELLSKRKTEKVK